ERREQVHAILAGALRPGGVLVLGSTEMIVDPTGLDLERVRPFVFRKIAAQKDAEFLRSNDEARGFGDALDFDEADEAEDR
ncbi:MAG: hypothetical protein ACPHCI_08185, partial [Solirubrobacterales bacterium]